MLIFLLRQLSVVCTSSRCWGYRKALFGPGQMSPTRHSITAISIAEIPLLRARCPRRGPTLNYICWPLARRRRDRLPLPPVENPGDQLAARCDYPDVAPVELPAPESSAAAGGCPTDSSPGVP
jgi:hypothetical protein